MLSGELCISNHIVRVSPSSPQVWPVTLATQADFILKL